MELCLQGSEEGIRMMFEVFGGKLYNRALRYLGCEQDAEECELETIYAVWEAIKKNKPIHLSYFMTAVLKNKVCDYIDKRNAGKRNCNWVIDYEEIEEYCIIHSSLPEFEESIVFSEIIHDYVDKMPALGREYFYRRFVYNEKYTDIAKAVGKSPDSVKMAIRRMCGDMRNYLMSEGYYS